MKMRIDKLLAHSGFGTRKEVKELIKEGLVEINGKTVKKPKEKADPDVDEVKVGVESVDYQEYVYFMLHKPQDVISATEDLYHHTVIDLLEPADILLNPFPVGRLDIDTTGLLLLTNNGKLSHALTSPNRGVSKVYQAEVDGAMDDKDVQAFKEGVVLDDGYQSLPADLKILEVDEAAGQSTIQLEITEGKYHQVKRMVQAVGKEVTALKRLSMGPIQLDEQLLAGEYRPLTEDELDLLEEYM